MGRLTQHADRPAAFRAFREANPNVVRASEVAVALGISESAARRLLRAEGVKPVATSSVPAAAVAPKIGVRPEACEVVAENPCTLDDLLVACKVDLTVWKVERFVVNKWEVGSKCEDGSVLRTPLFQIKAWLERSAELDFAKVLRDVVEEIRVAPPVSSSVGFGGLSMGVDDPHLLEVSLCDLHVGKRVDSKSEADAYDLTIAPRLALTAASELWKRASVFPVQRILLPLGNDFLNSDNAAGTTSAGTPQENDGGWQKSFRVAVKTAVDLIEFFRGKTEDGIDVVIVPGNHDVERSFYVGEVLRGIYSRTCDVRVNNDDAARKYFRWGTTLLGYAHGNNEKHGSLPLIMAGEASKDWAETTHREWHLGHLHHSRETRFHAGQEFGPVRVRVLPSLCPPDTWHKNSGFVGSKRAAEAYLWSLKHGYTGHLSYSVN